MHLRLQPRLGQAYTDFLRVAASSASICKAGGGGSKGKDAGPADRRWRRVIAQT
jgi:hypothetical protein